jgi:hypothetical protein
VESDRSWQRFGEPAAGDSGVAPVPRGGSRLDRGSNESWRRFERQPAQSPRDSRMNRTESIPRIERRSDSPRVERTRPESIRVAPPVVRERSIQRNDSGFGRSGGARSAPRMERPSSGGGFGMSRGESRGGGMSTRSSGSASGGGRVSRGGGAGGSRGGRSR